MFAAESAVQTAIIPALIAVGGVLVMAMVQWRTHQASTEAKQEASEAKHEADIVNGVLRGWEAQVASYQAERVLDRAEIARLQSRVLELERKL